MVWKRYFTLHQSNMLWCEWCAVAIIIIVVPVDDDTIGEQSRYTHYNGG
jgi:hypothetical protein